MLEAFGDRDDVELFRDQMKRVRREKEDTGKPVNYANLKLVCNTGVIKKLQRELIK